MFNVSSLASQSVHSRSNTTRASVAVPLLWFHDDYVFKRILIDTPWLRTLGLSDNSSKQRAHAAEHERIPRFAWSNVSPLFWLGEKYCTPNGPTFRPLIFRSSVSFLISLSVCAPASKRDFASCVMRQRFRSEGTPWCFHWLHFAAHRLVRKHPVLPTCLILHSYLLFPKFLCR